MSNISRAKSLLDQLHGLGVKEWVVCSGSRNAPFVKLLSQSSSASVHWFFEERSAAYFALGRIQKTHSPVAVITTSGTAVANLLPATVEGYYRQLPLILVTADRPSEFRHSGAPQAIDQLNIFGQYSEPTLEWPHEDVNIHWSRERPLHINIEFNEPIIDAVEELPGWTPSQMNKPWSGLKFNKEDSVKKVEKFFGENNSLQPLVVVSNMTAQQAKAVTPVLKGLKLPMYFECGSQFFSEIEEMHSPLLAGEFALQHYRKSELFNCIIRVGGVPTVRLWRDLERQSIPVLNFSTNGKSGLARPSSTVPFAALNDSKITEAIESASTDHVLALKELDGSLFKLKSLAINKHGGSEISLLKRLIQNIKSHEQIFVGNSLPIRELDLFPEVFARKQNVIFNQRGVNGIDGLVSTAYGVSEEKLGTWAILGDLTTLYDMSGVWPQKLNPQLKLNLVIVNNGGGKIFSRIYDDPHFENRHGLNFENFAQFWGMNYCLMDSTSSVPPVDGFGHVIEIQPDGKVSGELWKTLKLIAQ